jgi:hypothetical protein
MKRLIRNATLSTLLLIGSASITSAALPPGISGAWYNPEQSGHGLSIDMLSRDRALVSWSTMDLDGHPFNLYTEAQVEGERMIGRALAPRGLTFGVWDRADLEVLEWGEIRIDFSGCDTATLSWTPDGEAGIGFPAGNMAIRRLTTLAGMRCDFGRAASRPLPVDAVRVKLSRSTDSFPLQGIYYDDSTFAAIDPEGRLWALESLTYFGNTPAIFPYRNFQSVFPPTPAVVIGDPVPAGGGQLRVLVREQSVQPGAWTQPSRAVGSLTVANGQIDGRAQPAIIGRVNFTSLSVTSAPGVRRAELLPMADRTLDFAGTYAFVLRSPEGDHEAQLEVDVDGTLCLRLEPSLACEMEGQLSLAFTGQPFVDFVIEHRDNEGERYSGRGWLQRRTSSPFQGIVELVLVGVGANNDGWGIAGRRE